MRRSTSDSGLWPWERKTEPDGYQELRSSCASECPESFQRRCRYTYISRRPSKPLRFGAESTEGKRKSWYSVFEEVNEEFEQHCVFLPTSRFLYYWDVFIFMLSVLTGIYEPVAWAFRMRGAVSVGISFLLTATFGADTLINFFRASKESTQDGVILVTFVPDIAHRYLRGAFAVDLLSALPFFLLNRNYPWRLLRMLRLWRLGQLLAHFQTVTGFSFSVLNLSEFLLISFLVLHWIACMWLFIGLGELESWLTEAQEHLAFFETKSRLNVYLLSLYWSVTVLTSVGFGDITPMNRSEFCAAICCMAVGGGVWAYILGNVCGMVQALDKHRISFESTMNDVNVICSERRLPLDLQQRVREFYHHAREFLRMKQYHDTIEELSPALKGEVVRWMYGRCFRRVWYFDCMEDRCVSVLVEGMSPKMFAPQEFIEASVGTQRAIVFLRSGLCVRKCNLLAPGSVWGTDVLLSDDEQQDFQDLLDNAVARSLSFAFVLLLGKDSLDHVASLYPEVAARFRKAHCRLLMCRGIVAVAKAIKRREFLARGCGTDSHPLPRKKKHSHWDRLAESIMGKMGKETEGLKRAEQDLIESLRSDGYEPSPSHARKSYKDTRNSSSGSPAWADPTWEPYSSASAVDCSELPQRSSWRAKVDEQIEMRLERTAVRNFQAFSADALQVDSSITLSATSMTQGDVTAIHRDVAELHKEVSRMRGEIGDLKEIALENTRILSRLSHRMGIDDQNF